MKDDFFSKKHCDRCGKDLTVRIMSMFNTDAICMDCKKKEEKDPRYQQARQAEHDALVSGNRNFKGIGL